MMMFSLNLRRRSPGRSCVIFLIYAAALISALVVKSEAAKPTPAKPEPKSDVLSAEELRKLLGIWDNKAESSNIHVVTVLPDAPNPTATNAAKRSTFFPTEKYSTTTPKPAPVFRIQTSGAVSAEKVAEKLVKTALEQNDVSDASAQSSAELIQSLNLLNVLLGNPGDSGDVAATAAILTAASRPAKTTTTTTTTESPAVKTATESSAAHQSLALLNSLLGVGGVKSATGSSENLAAAAALLGLVGGTSMPVVRQAQQPDPASAAALTNLLLTQAGIALPLTQEQSKAKNNLQNFQGFSNSNANLDMAGTTQLSGLLSLLETLGSFGKPVTQNPLAGLLSFGQQAPQKHPDYLSALFGLDQKQKQDHGKQQMNSNILASLLSGQQSTQQQQQNLFANLLASASNNPGSNSGLNLFGTQTQEPGLLSSLGTLGSSAISLVGNTLNGLSGTRVNGKPRVRGVDTRVGLGYRLGPNADAQVIWEIGPQIFTDPITNEVKPIPTEKPSTLQKRLQYPEPTANLQAAASKNSLQYNNNRQSQSRLVAKTPTFQTPKKNRSKHQTTAAPKATQRSSEEESNEKEDSYVMLSALEKYLDHKEKNAPTIAPLPPVNRIMAYPTVQQKPQRNHPNYPVRGLYPGNRIVSSYQQQQHTIPTISGLNKIVRVSPGMRRPSIFPKQPAPTNAYSVRRVGQAKVDIPQYRRRIYVPPPPINNRNYSPWQNFIPEADDSFHRRNAGVEDPFVRGMEIRNERTTPAPPYGLGAYNRNPGQNSYNNENENRILPSMNWPSSTAISNVIRGGIKQIKASHEMVSRYFSTSTTPKPTQQELVEGDVVPSLLEHFRNRVPDEDDAIVKIGENLSFEQLLDSFPSSSMQRPSTISRPEPRLPPKIKYEDKKMLELKPISDHMKPGATDRPFIPPVEMFIDLENGELSVRNPVGSIQDFDKPWTPRTKTEEELEDEESGKIFQDVQEHLRASYEDFKLNKEIEKATKERKDKIKAGIDESMGLVTRYFDVMDAEKRKRDVSASESASESAETGRR